MQPLKYICALTVCLTAPLLMAGEATSNIPIDRTYIAGFLSGAQLTDGEIIRRFDKADNGKEQSDFFSVLSKPVWVKGVQYPPPILPVFAYRKTLSTKV